ncbi:hypothetical protein AIZ22_08930, partial [Salmonella enterica subsp. enterica serovar Typhimurium]
KGVLITGLKLKAFRNPQPSWGFSIDKNGKMVMVSEFFNEDDPDFDHSLDQKMAISWVESWEVVLADEEHK